MLSPFGWEEVGWRSFWVLASFRLSYRVVANLRLRQRPMIGNTRQNPKILAPNSDNIFLTALGHELGGVTFRLLAGRNMVALRHGSKPQRVVLLICL
jgi:hypothetical protein